MSIDHRSAAAMGQGWRAQAAQLAAIVLVVFLAKGAIPWSNTILVISIFLLCLVVFQKSSQPWLANNSVLCLIFGARSMESLFFHSEFLDLASRNSDFRYVPVLSRPHEAWVGASGYVQDHLDAISRTLDARAYLCGPLAMVETASRILLEQGWPEEMIHYERNGH